MQRIAADQAAKASQAENDQDEDGSEEGTSTEEEGGDLFPISPLHNKNKTPFSGQGEPFLVYSKAETGTQYKQSWASCDAAESCWSLQPTTCVLMLRGAKQPTRSTKSFVPECNCRFLMNPPHPMTCKVTKFLHATRGLLIGEPDWIHSVTHNKRHAWQHHWPIFEALFYERKISVSSHRWPQFQR